MEEELIIPISQIQSDRICGICIKLNDSLLTVLGVYLPCADAGIDKYAQVLCELRRLVTEG